MFDIEGAENLASGGAGFSPDNVEVNTTAPENGNVKFTVTPKMGNGELGTGNDWTKEIEGIAITADDVLVTRSPKEGLVVASEGAVVVGLETALTPELVAEGLAREFVSHVQSMRKEADFEVTQRIALTVETDEEMRSALEVHSQYVKGETLALSLEFASCDASEVSLNSHATKIKINKA